MNIEQAREALKILEFCTTPEGYTGAAYKTLLEFINEVEALLKHNSIKQVPALFKEKK